MEALAIKSFMTMLVVIDPPGLIPLYLGLNPTLDDHHRTARRAVVVASGVLLFFAIAGAWMLTMFGISLDAFRIAGGLLLLKIAVDMVFAQRERETPEEALENQARPDISVFPLAVPLIAGPGALASVMILAGEAERLPGLGLAIVLVMTAVVLALALGMLLISRRIARTLGQTGINVVTRLLGVVLAALAVQYVADGVLSLISSSNLAG